MAKTLSSSLLKSERDSVEEVLKILPWDDAFAQKVQHRSQNLVASARRTRRQPKDLESFFQDYGLDSQEGLALMCMAEALLRIPDKATTIALIRDKIASTRWLRSAAENKDWMTKAAGLGLSITSTTINSLFSKLGEPLIQKAMEQAMRILGKQFVIGETIEEAIKKSKNRDNAPYTMSFDMLGEGARTAQDAEYYFQAYHDALKALAAGEHIHGQAGLSIKLSALHPRYCYTQQESCIPVLTEKLMALCHDAARHHINLTIDAEEIDRLSLSLKVFQNLLLDPRLQEWNGLGLAVQSYHKASLDVVEHIAHLASSTRRRLQVRLVKGAYWDFEIKRAQILGLKEYPVYTRKYNTDASYLACVYKLFQHKKYLYPMLGTHNAHTISAVLEMADGFAHGDFEFQKLFGMGNMIYRKVMEEYDCPVRIYAPVGSHENLLPYLVRRLLENGANSSFVYKIFNKDIEIEKICTDPVQVVRSYSSKRHPHIALPAEIYGDRVNSEGLDIDDEKTERDLAGKIKRAKTQYYEARPLTAGKPNKVGSMLKSTNPANIKDALGDVHISSLHNLDAVFSHAQTGFQIWSETDPEQRARIIERYAYLLEENRAELLMLCMREGGKTLSDALAELREAVDFCRYYAMKGRNIFSLSGQSLRSPTGEENILLHKARGIFVCISPWNFPLAIFTGQVVAALMAGNAAIAKPAEQTSILGARLCELLLQAGVVPEALTLVTGDGHMGAALVQHPKVSGVAFTGSTHVARSINRTLAEKEGPIVPLIAETGGQNAMIVDSSALTEQVVDDVLESAFGSAGQRCSACRVLFLQDDIADRTITMLAGAMEELKVGNPLDIQTDIGPVIDEEALALLQKHKTRLEGIGKCLAQTPMHESLKEQGHYFAPCAYEIRDMSLLEEEVFGPILHVVRYAAQDIDSVIKQINTSGYGLTLGVHTRIDQFTKKIIGQIHVGNAYVNRSMTGAVVGVQPFGGCGLSGTGPKAGGPQYLYAFSQEKVISIDTTASGGNASLVTLQE